MKPKYISAAILLIVAIVIGIFSYNTVWLGDDINYAFDFREDHRNEIVSSFSQIIQSLNYHYLTVNGRYVAHVAVQYFCGIWGHLAFVIANAAAYVVFLLVLCRICYVKLTNLRGVLSVTLFALLVFQTKMVPSCQIGYIWTFALVMIFLILFFSTRPLCKWWQLILLGILSLIAGNGNEALTVGVSGALIIYWYQNRRSMSLRQYVMMICFGIGTMIICLSPAAHDRASTSAGIGSISWFVGNITYFFLTVRASFVMLAIILWKKYRSKISLRSIYAENAFWFNVWIIMMLFNMAIMFGSNRQIFGAELAAIIISIRLLKNHSFNMFGIVALAICLGLLYIEQFSFSNRIRGYYHEIERKYMESADGTIYVDVDMSNNIPYDMKFSPAINCVGLPNADYCRECLSRWLMNRHNRSEQLTVLPSVLQGNKTNSMKSNIYVIDSLNNIYMVVKNKLDGKKLYVERSIVTPFGHKEYEPMEIDVNENVICEGIDWVACIVDLNTYSIGNISKNKIVLQ